MNGLTAEDADADTSKENSFIDVNNDQMFDNSVFTEYDANEISCMSSKIGKKWRKKWTKHDARRQGQPAEMPLGAEAAELEPEQPEEVEQQKEFSIAEMVENSASITEVTNNADPKEDSLVTGKVKIKPLKSSSIYSF